MSPRTKEEVHAEITKLIQEMIHISDEDNERPNIMTGYVVMFESTAYGDEGGQMYRTDYFTHPSTGYVQVAGLLSVTEKQLDHIMFGHCGDHE